MDKIDLLVMLSTRLFVLDVSETLLYRARLVLCAIDIDHCLGLAWTSNLNSKLNRWIYPLQVLG